MIQWRNLLDAIGVEWRDRGPNCSRDHVNCCCPWCGDDPSFHLAISEPKGAYLCWRDSSHAGYNLRRLLVALGVPWGETADLLNQHNNEVAYVPAAKPPRARVAAAWDRFLPAADNISCVNYLRRRGFPTPVATCRLFDLRYAAEGSWARRLLLPIRDGGEVVTWTGRAISEWISPKYRMQQVDATDLVYLPHAVREVLVIVEGPLDALKIAAVADRQVSSVGLLGKGFSATRIRRLVSLATTCREVLIALDADVMTPDSDALYYELRRRLSCPVNNLTMLPGYKDAAELSAEQINGWISGR